MSIPRDLRVNIPGHGIDKFNAAYSYGGPKLTLKVIKQTMGIANINHVVNVDFTGFADAVNSIGCVYVDVDQHYYHSNVGLAPSEQYAEIDIPAGYQRMCGLNALSYVRYRHDDNDLVRSARQQEFLREMRQELPAGQIASDYDKLKSILQKYVTLDIQNTGDLLSLAQLIVGRQRRPGGTGPLPGPARRAHGDLRHRIRLGDQGGGREVRGADAHDHPGDVDDDLQLAGGIGRRVKGRIGIRRRRRVGIRRVLERPGSPGADADRCDDLDPLRPGDGGDARQHQGQGR